MSDEAQIAKWGNSLAIRIPKAVVRSAQLAEGDRLSMNLANDGSIVLRSTKRRYSLDELVARITPRNRHSETPWGKAVGREIW
jgi:antitoxin MazE